MARNRTLEETVVALRVEQAFFIEAHCLELMIDICSYNKVIQVLYKLEMIIVDRSGCFFVAVDEDVPAPPHPEYLRRRERVKAAVIHNGNTVFILKIGEILFKTLAGICTAGRWRKPCSCTYNKGFCVVKLFFYHLDLIVIVFIFLKNYF